MGNFCSYCHKRAAYHDVRCGLHRACGTCNVLIINQATSLPTCPYCAALSPDEHAALVAERQEKERLEAMPPSLGCRVISWLAFAFVVFIFGLHAIDHGTHVYAYYSENGHLRIHKA